MSLDNVDENKNESSRIKDIATIRLAYSGYIKNQCDFCDYCLSLLFIIFLTICAVRTFSLSLSV